LDANAPAALGRDKFDATFFKTSAHAGNESGVTKRETPLADTKGATRFSPTRKLKHSGYFIQPF
jgi:hypothetical protein